MPSETPFRPVTIEDGRVVTHGPANTNAGSVGNSVVVEPTRDIVVELLTDVVRAAADACDSAGWPYSAVRGALVAHVRELESRLATVEAELQDVRMSDCREVLCRVFDDFDEAWEEWLAWWNPTQWFHEYRALGAFIRTRIDARAACRAPTRSAIDAALETGEGRDGIRR